MYLHRGKVDFRKNINGLCAVVEHDLGLNPLAHAVFVFGNRRKDRIKILGWNRNGFWLLQKRLEDARFAWPQQDSAVVELTVQQLRWLLDGIDLAAMRGHRAMVGAATDAFMKYEADFVAGTVAVPLLEKSTDETLRKTLKNFSYMQAYKHRSVLEVELQGYNVIRGALGSASDAPTFQITTKQNENQKRAIELIGQIKP